MWLIDASSFFIFSLQSCRIGLATYDERCKAQACEPNLQACVPVCQHYSVTATLLQHYCIYFATSLHLFCSTTATTFAASLHLFLQRDCNRLAVTQQNGCGKVAVKGLCHCAVALLPQEACNKFATKVLCSCAAAINRKH